MNNKRSGPVGRSSYIILIDKGFTCSYFGRLNATDISHICS